MACMQEGWICPNPYQVVLELWRRPTAQDFRSALPGRQCDGIPILSSHLPNVTTLSSRWLGAFHISEQPLSFKLLSGLYLCQLDVSVLKVTKVPCGCGRGSSDKLWKIDVVTSYCNVITFFSLLRSRTYAESPVSYGLETK